MDKCSPVDMRKNLQAVEAFKRAGIDFVPIPVTSEEHKLELITMMRAALVKAEGEG